MKIQVPKHAQAFRRAHVASVPSLFAVLVPSLLGAFLALAAAPLSAQTTPPQATAPAPSEEPTEAVTLDPFEVQATSDTSYGALNSNSITAFNTALDKMPVSADIFDKTFMDDTGFSTVEEMLDFYAAGSGTASQAPDLASTTNQFLDRPSNATFSIRGLSAPAALVNGFFPVGTGGVTGEGVTSNFDLEKVEIVEGPQSLLYGVSGAGGAINYTTKQAQLGVPAFGEEKFQVDQYGNKLDQLDLGEGTDTVAVRVALVDQTLGARRINVGGPMQGGYLQLAVRPVKNTIIRVDAEQQTFDRFLQTTMELSAASTSNDARNGDNLTYLLATNQLQAAANGAPSGAGPLSWLNWNNVQSLAGDFQQEYRDYHRMTATVDTNWTSWLSSQVAAGYSALTGWKFYDTNPELDAPNVSANPTGTFAVVVTSTVAEAEEQSAVEKAARFSLLADNHLFDDKVESKTAFGADDSRTDSDVVESYYVQADSNWNLILTPGTSYNGATPIGTVYFGVPNGPVTYPLFNPDSPRITYNGVNYVRAVTNDSDAALISPGNPEGLTGHGKGDYNHAVVINDGLYAANYSDFLNGNLDTLLGARVGSSYYRNMGSSTSPPSTLTQSTTDFVDLDAGFDVHVIGGLRAYADVSQSDNPPTQLGFNPLGEPVLPAKALGEEVGLKDSFQPWNLSGQLALYHTASKNEETQLTSTLVNDINPTGLNGQYNSPSTIVNVNRITNGASMTVTAAPGSWRLRVSAAINQSTITNAVAFPQLYNDQFYENSAGDVTYADGTVVYVNPTFNSKGTIAAPATSAPAGYVPLTVAQMNNSASPYYANPEPITSSINPSSNVHTVLEQTDPVHGSIVTGANGLPISDLQIAPNAASPPPGTIALYDAGDLGTGVPKFSANFAAVYTVPNGPIKGLRLGGLGSFGWKIPMYYYYPEEVSSPTIRTTFDEPTQAVFTGLIGYTRKFQRVTFSTQINANNIFNHYHVLILPDLVDGYLVPSTLNATFDQQPRMYVWTNTISF